MLLVSLTGRNLNSCFTKEFCNNILYFMFVCIYTPCSRCFSCLNGWAREIKLIDFN